MLNHEKITTSDGILLNDVSTIANVATLNLDDAETVQDETPEHAYFGGDTGDNWGQSTV